MCTNPMPIFVEGTTGSTRRAPNAKHCLSCALNDFQAGILTTSSMSVRKDRRNTELVMAFMDGNLRATDHGYLVRPHPLRDPKDFGFYCENGLVMVATKKEALRLLRPPASQRKYESKRYRKARKQLKLIRRRLPRATSK